MSKAATDHSWLLGHGFVFGGKFLSVHTEAACLRRHNGPAYAKTQVCPSCRDADITADKRDGRG